MASSHAIIEMTPHGRMKGRINAYKSQGMNVFGDIVHMMHKND
jgi:hypothetical protein